MHLRTQDKQSHNDLPKRSIKKQDAMQPISQYLLDNPHRPMTLLELSRALNISKDTARHQSKRALSAGEIVQAGRSTDHGGSPAATYSPHPRLLLSQEPTTTPPLTLPNGEPSEILFNARAMAFITQSLSGLPPIPEEVRALLERRKTEHNLQKVAC